MIKYSSMTAIAVPKRRTTRTRCHGQQPPEGDGPEHLPLVGAVGPAASNRSRGIVARPARKNIVW